MRAEPQARAHPSHGRDLFAVPHACPGVSRTCREQASLLMPPDADRRMASCSHSKNHRAGLGMTLDVAWPRTTRKQVATARTKRTFLGSCLCPRPADARRVTAAGRRGMRHSESCCAGGFAHRLARGVAKSPQTRESRGSRTGPEQTPDRPPCRARRRLQPPG